MSLYEAHQTSTYAHRSQNIGGPKHACTKLHVQTHFLVHTELFPCTRGGPRTAHSRRSAYAVQISLPLALNHWRECPEHLHPPGSAASDTHDWCQEAVLFPSEGASCLNPCGLVTWSHFVLFRSLFDLSLSVLDVFCLFLSLAIMSVLALLVIFCCWRRLC